MFTEIVPRNPDDSYTIEKEYVDSNEIDSFIEKFDNISIGEELHFEMWGGEPFLYYAKMKSITEKLHAKFPEATFSVITNGSILNEEIRYFKKMYIYKVT